MPEFGYALSSEEHAPNDLVRFARRAEEVGFNFAMISDHYHPWIERQGQSPFVWSVLGAIASATHKLQLGTGVTCPSFRIHPAIIAQAAATIGSMMPGRFFLGLGSGEALNEHILGEHWPPAEVRLNKLGEAVEVIRQLWEGDEASHYGEFFTVENAKVYTLPDELPPIYIAASAMDTAEMAGEIGDGLICTTADSELISEFEAAGGRGKPKIGQVKICWADDEDKALQTVSTWWPVALIPGSLHSDLPTPAHFEDAISLVKEEDLKQKVTMGPDIDRHLEKVRKMVDAGFTHVYIHQVGPDQEGFFQVFEHEMLPKLQRM